MIVKKHMKVIIVVTLCLLIAIGAFFFFYIPGAWIGGIAEISTESHVVIQQDTATKDSSGNLEHTYTDFTLTAEQIEMLKEFIHSSSFTRSLRGTLYHKTTDMESYNTYDIIIHDDNFIAVHDGIRIGISWGYFSGFKQSGNGWIKINNTNWEDSITQILAHSSR